MNRLLHVKITIAVFVSAACLAVVLSLWQYATTYQKELANAQLALSQLAATVQHTAAIATYLDNKEIAGDVVHGLAKNDIVAVVKLKSLDGLEVAAGKVDQGSMQLTPVTYKLQSPFSDNEQVGQLTIIPKQVLIVARARDAAYKQAVIMGLNTFVVAFLVMIVVYRLLIRPIKTFSFELSRAIPGETTAIECPSGHSRDEIGRLTEDANRLLVHAKQILDEERALQEELHQHRDHLEELVCQRTEELQAETRRAEAASKAKSEFLSLMSHELRTPLNAIIGFSQILECELQVYENQEHLDDIGRIISASNHLLSIINSVLDLSKVESGKMELSLEDFSVSELCDEVAIISKPLVEKNNNRLVLHCDVENTDMFSDRQKLKQILLNLLSNAAKFSDDSEIRLVVNVHSDRPEHINFAITDHGIGISEEKIQTLFQPFTQIDYSSTRKFDGTGLGLYLSKRYVELLHGSIQVQSREGAGSTFSVDLPRIVKQSGSFPSTQQHAMSHAH